MNDINHIIAADSNFSKLLFELEQINLRLLVELKQHSIASDCPKPSNNNAKRKNGRR